VPEVSVQLTEKAKEWFLQIAEDFSQSQERYNLNHEFARTRKNRSLVVILTITGIAFLFVSLAYVFTTAYEKENNQVTVSSSEFEDIDLRDLLDTYQKLETELLYHRAALENAVISQRLEQTRVESAYADQVLMAKDDRLDDAAAKVIRDALDQRLVRDKGRIEAKYRDSLVQLTANVQKVEADISAIDKNKLDRALAQEALLSGERRLFNLEMDRLKRLYDDQIVAMSKEHKSQIDRKNQFAQEFERQSSARLQSERARLTLLYNPVLSSAPDLALLEQSIDRSWLLSYKPLFPSIQAIRDAVGDAPRQKLRTHIARVQELNAILSRPPYLNSVPPIVAQLYNQTILALAAALEPYTEVAGVIDAKNQELVQKKQELEAAARLEQELRTAIANQESILKDTSRLASGYIVEASKEVRKFAEREKQQGVVSQVVSQDELVVVAQDEQVFPKGSIIYVARWMTPALGQFEVVMSLGHLRKLRRLSLSLDMQAAFDKLEAGRKAIVVNDWVIRQEAYKAP